MNFLFWKKEKKISQWEVRNQISDILVDMEIDATRKIHSILRFCTYNLVFASKLLCENYYYVHRDWTKEDKQQELIWNRDWGDPPKALSRDHYLAFYDAFKNGELQEILKVSQERDFLNGTSFRIAEKVRKEVEELVFDKNRQTLLRGSQGDE